MDPNLRSAVERVTAWHLARFRAHITPPEPTMPPAAPPQPDVLPPVTDPRSPGQASPVQEPVRPQQAPERARKNGRTH
jgi:hypothetical protein